MIEEGIEDYRRAKLKAVERLGLRGVNKLPRNEAVDSARLEFQRIFQSETRASAIARMRHAALDIMQRLESFSPLLTGSLVDGSAGTHTPITIQVFPETAEDLIRILIDLSIPYRETSHAVAVGRDGSAVLPAISFVYDHSHVDLQVFPPEWADKARGRRGDAAPRVSTEDLRRLLATPQGAPAT